MRTRHTSHALPGFPVYSSAFLSNTQLILGGGGGVGRSGVKNRIRLYRVQDDTKMEMLDEFELEKGEDAPMSMALHMGLKELVCGINSIETQLLEGKNENCRVYNVEADKIKPSKKCGTFQLSNEEDYQKVTVFSPNQDLIAVGSTSNEVVLLSYPSLVPAVTPIHLEGGDLYDATFSSTSFVVATSKTLYVYTLSNQPKTGKGKGKGKAKASNSLKLMETIGVPASLTGMTFRAAQFHPTEPHILYTILNSSLTRTRTSKTAQRRAYICKWDTNTWEVVKMRKIGEKSVTCFHISADGRLVAYGSSDYAIGILDSQTFAPLLTILKAHDFPLTTLRFNPDATLLMSGSADSSVRLVVVPKSFGSSWTTTVLIVLALLVLVLAVALQQGMILRIG